MPQMLLFPDPRPLVERLGEGFFKEAPDNPGVYLMRDAADAVLYVGKAKSLRKRLAHYRVANPDRMRRRHLRLLRAVARIELQECPNEVSALERESELLRALRPRFNRAGTWPAPPRYFTWRVTDAGIEMAVSETIEARWDSYPQSGETPLPLGGACEATEAGWQFYPRSLGAGAIPLRATLVRLLWSAIHPARGFAGMPAGWFRAQFGATAIIPRKDASNDCEESANRLSLFFTGQPDSFIEWIRERACASCSAFDATSLETDLESLVEFAERL